MHRVRPQPVALRRRIGAVVARFVDDFFVEPLHRAAAEQRAFLASPDSRGIDLRVATVLVSTALLLTVQHYGFRLNGLHDLLAALRTAAPDAFAPSSAGGGAIAAIESERLAGNLYWAAGQVLVYVAFPLFAITLAFRQPLADYGVKLRGTFVAGWAYLVMAAVMLPCVLVASTSEGFQRTYPFYKVAADESLWPRFWIWEGAYMLQFVALEFFFRGYVLHGTRRRFGPYAMFVMMVPYCMIHYGKPLPETLGAIGAGIVLGFMSLKTRSIWLGAALHVAVALTMDLAALWHLGRLR